MRAALDHYERQLVEASRALHEQTPGEQAAPSGRSRVAPALSLVRRWRWRAPLGALALGALVAAGSTLVGSHGNPRYGTSIECGNRIVQGVTGEPVGDCTTLWPSLYHRRAPRLAAWVAASGGGVVVVPAGTRPPGNGALHWTRLPSGWSEDRTVAALVDQLDDVAGGIGSQACWSSGAALAVADATLRADALPSWRVQVKREPGEGSDPNCLAVDPSVDGANESVLLVERPVARSRYGVVASAAGARQRSRIVAATDRVRAALARSCTGLAQAGALWRAQAHEAGVGNGSYVVFTGGSTWARASQCAQLTVDAPGGGGRYDVYIDGPR